MESQLPHNYLGAAIFWLYNVAALGFTAIVIYTIINLPRRQDGAAESRRRTTVLFATLAALSFSTLSYNMLSVLIQSYLQWASSHENMSHNLVINIWQWSITSTLFQDFGEAIVADKARYVWTVSALFATMAVFCYMAIEGRRKSIPRLWTFFALSQILPISFAQNLFYIALIRQPPSAQPVSVRAGTYATILMAYTTGLSMAQGAAHTSLLIPLIVIARLLLLGQLLVVETGTGIASPAIARRMQLPIAFMALLLTGGQAYLAGREHSLSDVIWAVGSHPAVSSLGIDFLLSAISLTVWLYTPALSDDSHGRIKKTS